MKKFFTILSLIASAAASAQSGYANVTFNKVARPALMLTVPYKEDVAEGAILDNLKKTGYDAETKGKLFWKQNKVNGFYNFKAVNLNNNLVDLYFRVDQKSRKSQQSTIYLLVAQGDGRFITSADTPVYDAAKKFLDGFLSETATYKLQLDIEGQETAVKDAEKKLAKLKDNEQDMEKKIRDLQDDIKKNKSDQADQEKQIEQDKKKLQELKTKATGNN